MSSSEDDLPASGEAPLETLKSAKKAQMEARCQSVVSDETSRRGSHEDGVALCKQILAKYKTFTQGWCNLTTLKPSKTDGYVQISHGGANKFTTLGCVVLWASGRAKPAYSGKTDPWDVSHLCDEPRCTVLEHVTVESRQKNNARKGCVGSVLCSRNCGKCRGLKYLFICPHAPRCIRHRPGYRSPEDFIENGLCEDRSPIVSGVGGVGSTDELIEVESSDAAESSE